MTTYYNKASFISINSHLLFRRKQNVQNILFKRVEDISKQYLLILYVELSLGLGACNESSFGLAIVVVQ